MCNIGEVFDVLEELCQRVCDSSLYTTSTPTEEDDELRSDASVRGSPPKSSLGECGSESTEQESQTTTECLTTNEDSSSTTTLFMSIDEPSVEYSAIEMPLIGADESTTNETESEIEGTSEEKAVDETSKLKAVEDKYESSKKKANDEVSGQKEFEPQQKAAVKDSSTTIVEEPPLQGYDNNYEVAASDAAYREPVNEKSPADEAEENLPVNITDWPIVDVTLANVENGQLSDAELLTRDLFLYQIDELFEQMQKKKFCFDSMRAIAKCGAELLQQNMHYCSETRKFSIPFDTMKIAADRLQAATVEIDIRIRTKYLNVFYALFMLSNEFQQVMQYVYSLHFKSDNSSNNVNGEKVLPHLHVFFSSYEDLYANTMQEMARMPPPRYELPQDYVYMCNLTQKLAFLLTISPRATLRRLVIDHVTKENTFEIFNLARVLRYMPALCDLRMPSSQGLPDKSCSVMVALIYRFWFTFTRSERNAGEVPDIDFANKKQCDRMITLLSIFTITRRCRGLLLLRPVFDPNELVVDFVAPQLSPNTSHSPLSLNFALDLLDRLLIRRSVSYYVDESIIRWKGEKKIRGELAADLGAIIGYLADSAMTNLFSRDISHKCFRLGRRLFDIVEAQVMKNENVDNRNGSHHDDQSAAVIMRTDLIKNVQQQKQPALMLYTAIASQPGNSSRAAAPNQFLSDVSRLPPPTFITERVFQERLGSGNRRAPRRGDSANDGNRGGAQTSHNRHNGQHSNAQSGSSNSHQRSLTDARGQQALQDATDHHHHTIVNKPATERFQQAGAVKRRPDQDRTDTDSLGAYGEIPQNLILTHLSPSHSQPSSCSSKHRKQRRDNEMSHANSTPIAPNGPLTSSVLTNVNGLFRNVNNSNAASSNKDSDGQQQNQSRQSR